MSPKVGEGGDEPVVRLAAKWETLIEALYQANGRSVVDYLPDIIELIQSSNPKSAEIGLLSVLHSPAVRRHSPEFELVTSTTVVPHYVSADLFADAVRFPSGDVREHTKALVRLLTVGKALTPEQSVLVWEATAKAFEAIGLKQETDEAATKRARRARRLLGISRPRGRPKGNGQK